MLHRVLRCIGGDDIVCYSGLDQLRPVKRKYKKNSFAPYFVDLNGYYRPAQTDVWQEIGSGASVSNFA